MEASKFPKVSSETITRGNKLAIVQQIVRCSFRDRIYREEGRIPRCYATPRLVPHMRLECKDFLHARTLYLSKASILWLLTLLNWVSTDSNIVDGGLVVLNSE